MTLGFARPIAVVLAVVALIGATLTRIHAHDVPNEVTIQAFIAPEGSTLRVLVRVPLVAMRDMTWPLRGPDVLDVGHATSELANAATLWIGDDMVLYEDGRRIRSPRVAAVRATVAGNRDFESYDRALALVTGPREPDSTELIIRDGFLDVLFEYPMQSAAARFSIEPRWGRLGVQAISVLRLIRAGQIVRQFEVRGDPGPVRLDPSWLQTFGSFFHRGSRHTLDASGTLLFLICLVVPFRRSADAIVVAAAFVVASSMTLAAAIYGFTPDVLWYPSLVDTLVALSILYVAVENIVGTTVKRRWPAAFMWGLVHGFAISMALRPALQFAGAHEPAALFAFAMGIDLGVATALALLVPSLNLVFRFAVPEHLGRVVISAIVAHAGWHWLTASAALLWQYHITWPPLTPAFFADVLRWLMLAVSAAGVMWIGSLALNAMGLSRSSTP